MTATTVGRRAFCAAAILVSCGGHAAKNHATGGGGSSGSSTAISSSSTGPSAPVFYASLVAETQPGEAPAYLSLENDTDVYLSLWIGGAAWIAVPAGTTTDAQLSWTADIAKEIKIGYCLPNGGSCVTFHPNIKSGPNAWTPGKYYLVTATGTKGSVDLDMAEVAGEPFVAIRGWDVPHVAGGNALNIEFGGGVPPIAFETPYGTTTPYQLVAKSSEPQIARVRFTVEGSADGKERSADFPAKLTGASGFTVVIDKMAAPGAIASEQLK